MNERIIQKFLNEFCQNPYWREYYETAPSNACKRYIELGFYFSDHLGVIPDYDNYKKERTKLENKFTKADWEHLYKHCANNPHKTYYRNKIKEAKQ